MDGFKTSEGVYSCSLLNSTTMLCVGFNGTISQGFVSYTNISNGYTETTYATGF
jgi:hypothetical protein